MVCASTARRDHGLNNSELGMLECTVMRNPHFSNAAPMRLYALADVLTAAARKAEAEAVYKATARERARERARAKAEAHKQEAASAAATVRGFRTDEVHVRAGASPLPTALWGMVLYTLGQGCKFRGPREHSDFFGATSVVARDMCHAAASCRDLRAAAFGWGWAGMVDAITCPNPGRPHQPPKDQQLLLRTVVQTPTSLSLARLKDAARLLRLKTSGTKAELVLRLLEEGFGLSAPNRTVPAAVLRAVQRERLDVAFTWLPAIMRVGRLLQRRDNPFVGRSDRGMSAFWAAQQLVAMFGTEEAYLAACHALGDPPTCACGGTASTRCLTRACGRCCTSHDCPRHSKKHR